MNNNSFKKSSQKMLDALFSFKGRVGNGDKAPADYVLMRLATDVDIAHVGYEYFKLNPSLLKERVSFVASSVDEYFEDQKLPEPEYSALGNGGQSLVLDCNNGYVVKIRTGTAYTPPESPMILSQEHGGHDKNLDVCFGVFEKVEPYTPSFLETRKMVMKSAFQGVFLQDASIYNFGYKKNEQGEKTLVLLDADAARPFNGVNDAIQIGFDSFVKPIYAGMPFIHPHWRAFKKVMHEEFGIGPKPRIKGDPLKLIPKADQFKL